MPWVPLAETGADRRGRVTGWRAVAVAGLALVLTAGCASTDGAGDEPVSGTAESVFPSGETAAPVDDDSSDRTAPEVPAASGDRTDEAELPATPSTAPSDPLAAAPPEELPLAVGPGRLGISPGSMVLDLDDSDRALDLDRVVDIGADWIRIDIDWSRIEAEPGTLDWSTTDPLVVAARQRGLHVLGLLAYTPTWARPPGTPDKAPPVDPADFADFVEAVIARYGDHVRAWEIWNEPNVASFWFPEPDPEAYGEILGVSAEVIRRMDPEALIVTGGLAPALDSSGELAPATFLARLYAVARSDWFDAVGVHPYTYPGFPSESQEWNLFAALPRLHELMVELGDGDTPIWLTEYGAPTGDGARAVSEEIQAEMVRDAIRSARELEWAGPLFLYSLRDLPGGPSDDTEANFGLFRADRSEKPAAASVRELSGDGSGG